MSLVMFLWILWHKEEKKYIYGKTLVNEKGYTNLLQNYIAGNAEKVNSLIELIKCILTRILMASRNCQYFLNTGYPALNSRRKKKQHKGGIWGIITRHRCLLRVTGASSTSSRKLTASERPQRTAILAPKIKKWQRNEEKSDETEMKDSAGPMGQYGAEQSNCWAPRNYMSHGAGRGSTDGVSRLACYRFEGRGLGGLFSAEKAICPSVSNERRVPTGRRRDGYLKMGWMEKTMERGEESWRRSVEGE